VTSLPVHVQEQSIKAIQKFLNCVAVIDSDPPPAVHCTEAKVVEVDMTPIARVPKATTIANQSRLEKIYIGRSLKN
jgi:hypothetical protein